ncbi:MAG: hypothetical protein ABI318_13470, partial [Chthoniobacteraceae bacterium]
FYSMQRILIVLLAVTTTISTWFVFQYRDQASAKDAQIANLTAERDTARAAERAALADAGPLRENIERLTQERDRLLAQAREQRPQDAGPGGPPPGSPDGSRPTLGRLAAMLQTPEGKKMFRNQSANIVRSRYADFAKRMKLSPQDTTVMMNLLADRHAALLSARVTSGGDSEKIAAQTSTIEGEFSGKLLATIGQSGLDQLNEYDQSVEERSMVGQLEEQFNSAGLTLDPTQKEGLISLMQTERQNSPANPLDPAKADPTTVLNLLKDDNTMVTWEKQQQDYQNRVIQQAASTLTPDQVNTLKQSMQQNLDRDKAALQMFKTTGVPPPPPPK